MISAEKKVKRMVDVARLYYEENLSQSQIAVKLGISRPLVSVILTEARESGIVTITIRDAIVSEEQVIEKLRKSFRISEVITVPDAANDGMVNAQIARVAFHSCFSRANDGKRLGIGWETIMGIMADYADTLENAAEGRGAIFPLVGGVNSVTRGFHVNELVRIFSLKTGRQPRFLYIPALHETAMELETLKNTEAYSEILEEWEYMEQALIAISNFPSYPDLGVKSLYGNALTEKKAVGRMLAHYFDAYGRIISPASDSTFQASIHHLRQTDVTAVCSNQVTPQCVVGALRTGIIDRLVLPFSLAEKVSTIIF